MIHVELEKEAIVSIRAPQIPKNSNVESNQWKELFSTVQIKYDDVICEHINNELSVIDEERYSANNLGESVFTDKDSKQRSVKILAETEFIKTKIEELDNFFNIIKKKFSKKDVQFF